MYVCYINAVLSYIQAGDVVVRKRDVGTAVGNVGDAGQCLGLRVSEQHLLSTASRDARGVSDHCGRCIRHGLQRCAGLGLRR